MSLSKSIRKLLSAGLMSCTTVALSHPRGSCKLVREYYPFLARQFAEFLIKNNDKAYGNEDDKQRYRENFKHYMTELDRWKKDYCICIHED